MIDKLRSEWHRDMSFDAIVKLSDDLDAMLQRIRSDRQIRPPVFRCPECGYVGEAKAPRVSVRATILSVIRFKIDAAEPTRTIERAWNGYRKQNGLDLYGKSPVPNSDGPGCGHFQVE